MIKAMAPGKYIPQDSFIHNLDPRIKIVFSVAFFVLCFELKQLLSVALLFAFVAVLTKATQIPFIQYLKSNRHIIIASFFTAFINLFFEVQTRFVIYQKFEILPFSVKNSVIIVIRLLSLVFMSSAIMFTTSPNDISSALARLLKPLKYTGVNVEEIAITITISLRFIPTLFEEATKIATAQRARGAHFNSKNLIKKFKAFSSVIIPLFVSSFKKAEFLAEAMESRAYDTSRTRTKYKESKIQNDDIKAIICAVAIFLGAIICNQTIQI